MTIRQAMKLGTETLAATPDPKTDAASLLTEVTGIAPMNLYLYPQQEVTVEQEERYRSLLLLRAQRQPLQYLLKRQFFYGRAFAADERVLIPRPETELLCELAIALLQASEAPRALDLCTGSGAIAITLALQCPKAILTAADISPDALSVARSNAKALQAAVRFVQGDLLDPLAGECFEVIVCNPPYIESDECNQLQPEVMLEPRLALDGGTDGLDFYRRLAEQAPRHLTDGGSLMVELGHTQAKAVAALFAQTGRFTDVHIYEDYSHIQRFVTARHAAFPT